MFRTVAFHTLLFLLHTSAFAGPGQHDASGGHIEAPAASAASAPRLESVGSTMELVATSKGHTLTIYLDQVDTNEPIDDAKIEISGDEIATATAQRVAPGTYELEADWVDAPGAKALIFTVTTPNDADLLNGTWTVPEPDANTVQPPAPSLQDLIARMEVIGIAVAALALGFVLAFAIRLNRRRSDEDSIPDDALSAPMTRAAALRSAAEMLVLSAALGAMIMTPALAGPGQHDASGGHGEAPAATSGVTPRKLPDGSIYVPKQTQRLLEVRTAPVAETSAAQVREMIGTIVSDPSYFGQVQAPMDGQIQVSKRGISFVGQKVQAGEILALLVPSIPVADLGTMQQLRAEVEGKLAVAEQKLERLQRIANVVAKSQIEDTEAELIALREQKRVLERKDTEKMEIKAPVSGVISVANVRAGQVVSARDTLFEIVDPEKLWVEAVSSETHDIGGIASATALDNNGQVLQLKYVGRAPTLRQQSRPFFFSIAEPHSDLVIGSPAKVQIQTLAEVKGLILPEAAVVRGANGLPLVWVKQSPELFRPIEVRTQPLDGGRTLVLAGLKPGDRVVMTAAELINQIR